MQRRFTKTILASVLALVLLDVASGLVLPRVFHDPHFDDSVDGVSGNLAMRNNVLLRIKRDFPSKKDPGEYVIGVFGGSVADSFAVAANDMLPSVPSAVLLAQRLGKRVRIENFALGGGAEPGQLNLLHLFHAEVDAAVFLDGYNELKTPVDLDGHERARAVAALWERNQGDLPTFPARLVRTRERLLRLTTFPIWPLVGHSGLLRAYVYNESRDLTAATNQFYDTLDRLTEEPSQSGTPFPGGIDLWEQCIELSGAFARESALPIHFFLQPNQYVRDSKPLSSEEKACCLNREGQDEEWEFSQGLDRSFAEMGRRVESLRSHGLPVTSLTQIFGSVTSTVYADRCCHLNRNGEAIMAEAMFHELLAALP